METVRLRFSFAVSLLWMAAVMAVLGARPAQPETRVLASYFSD